MPDPACRAETSLAQVKYGYSSMDIQYKYTHRYTIKFKLTNLLNQLKILLSLLVFWLRCFKRTTMQNAHRRK